MRKTAIILLFLVLLLSACSAEASVNTKVVAENIEEEPKLSCPRGIHNDPYPGRCPLYTDSDSDGFCDYG